MRADVALLSLALFFEIGCAGGAQIVIPEPRAQAMSELSKLINSPLSPPRQMPLNEVLGVVDRVDRRVQSAAIDVCRRTFNNPQDCARIIRSRTLVVDVNNPGINAYVGENFDIAILGGLVRASGSDDEIAFILAHEYAHALFGHVGKTMDNAVWGEIIAGLAGLSVIASNAGNITDEQIDAIAYDGTALGREIGATVFSKGMELEADHLAMFIVEDADYSMEEGMKLFQRMLRMQNPNTSDSARVLGFFRTHPSDTERLLQLLTTKQMIESGTNRPTWKQ